MDNEMAADSAVHSIIIICNFSPLFRVSGEKQSVKPSELRSSSV